MNVSHNTPFTPPPSGVSSNFRDPETRSPLFRSILIICLALIWPVFLLRVYTKLQISKVFGFDDVSSALAVISTTAFVGMILYELTIIGPHGWDIRFEALTPEFSAISTTVQVSFAVCLFFTKLSIFLLYLRLFKVSKTMRWLLHFGIFSCLAVYFASGFAQGFLCVRRPWETWLESLQSDRCTKDSVPWYYVQGIFGLVSDIYIFILPIPIVWHLNMRMRKRLGVLGIFALGIISIMASGLGVYVRYTAAIDVENVVWYLPAAVTLAAIELSTGIICGCVPHLPPFFRRHRPSLPAASSLRRLLTRGKSHPPSDTDDFLEQHLDAISQDGRRQQQRWVATKRARIETDVLGTMKGDGAFMDMGIFGEVAQPRFHGAGALRRSYSPYNCNKV